MCSVGELTFANVYNKRNEHIIGFDVNSLYPYTLMFPMPVGGFEWEHPTTDTITNYSLGDEYGYLIECDIHVPSIINTQYLFSTPTLL